MFDHKEDEEIARVRPPRGRRSFLRQVALAAGGAPACSILLPGINSAATLEIAEVAPASCATGRIPMKQVEGKVAFITGGSSGIGLGIARAFAEAGMNVVVGYKTAKNMDEAFKVLGSDERRVHAIKIDVTDRRSMERAATESVQRFGRVHVLVNNAGVVHFAPLRETGYDDWDWVINTNINGVFNGVHAFLPHILAHGEGGQIITTSSIAGLIADGGCVSYTTSKFAVVGMMEALRSELQESNVGVSVCCPGAVKSNIGNSSRNRPGASVTSEVSSVEKEPDSSILMDPDKVGRLVLRGMRLNNLYILTHPEYEQIIRDRNEALVASLQGDLYATDAQIRSAESLRRKSVYMMERSRRLCAYADKLK